MEGCRRLRRGRPYRDGGARAAHAVHAGGRDLHAQRRGPPRHAGRRADRTDRAPRPPRCAADPAPDPRRADRAVRRGAVPQGGGLGDLRAGVQGAAARRAFPVHRRAAGGRRRPPDRPDERAGPHEPPPTQEAPARGVRAGRARGGHRPGLPGVRPAEGPAHHHPVGVDHPCAAGGPAPGAGQDRPDALPQSADRDRRPAERDDDPARQGSRVRRRPLARPGRPGRLSLPLRRGRRQGARGRDGGGPGPLQLQAALPGHQRVLHVLRDRQPAGVPEV